MRISIVLLLLGLSFVILSQALAQEPGSIGTVECREVQLQIQDTEGMEDHYKNHGQLVKTVVHALKSAKKTKLITGKCASCIFTQFVLRIPIEEQKACGSNIESFDTIETVACCLMNDDCVNMTPEDCEAERGSTPMSSGSNCETVDCASAY